MDKNTYKSLVWSLWYYGVANIKSIQLKPSKKTRYPTGYFKTNGIAKISGFPHELMGWLEKDNWSIQSNLPLNKFMLYHKTAFIVKKV